MMPAEVHVGAMPAMLVQEPLQHPLPVRVCATSGWNCTPARRSATSSNAATGARSLLRGHGEPVGRDRHAVAVAHPDRLLRPAVAEQLAAARRPVSAVPPNSRWPVCATSPPSARAIAWNP